MGRHLRHEGHMPSLAGPRRGSTRHRSRPSACAAKSSLVDFWTYTCINWLRTLPYVRAWAKKYKTEGSS